MGWSALLLSGCRVNMKDNQLIQIFSPIISQGLIDAGISGVTVMQEDQPTQQGINDNPTIYFQKISSKKCGSQGFRDFWNEDTEEMEHTEVLLMECMFKVSCLFRQNPETPNQLTASDLVQEVAIILNSQKTIQTLQSYEIGIMNIMDMTNPYFINDRNQYYAKPSFNFILRFVDRRLTTVPVVTLPVELRVYPVSTLPETE